MKALMTGKGEPLKTENSPKEKRSEVQGLQLQSQRDSDLDSDQETDQDELDVAISKCLDDQTSLKKLQISKVKKGHYKIEQKEFPFKLLQGNNLAIKMHAGYIYADCLVHFEEELLMIVK